MPEIPIQVLLPSVIEEFTNNLSHPLRLKLFENNLWDWYPEADMHLFHGLGDELIPHENSELAYDTFIENGSENIYLYLAPEEYGGHSEVAQYCLISAYQICEDNYKNILNKGDLNNDQIFNIQDILIIIQLILNQENEDSLLLWISDTSMDGEINVLDIIILTNLILGETF